MDNPTSPSLDETMGSPGIPVDRASVDSERFFDT